MVTRNVLRSKRDDDYVWISHGGTKSEHGKNELVAIHLRLHLWWYAVGGAFRLFRVSHQIDGVESSKLRVHDRLDLLLHVQYFRYQYGSSIQRYWTMARLPLWRTNLHYPQLCGKISLGLASIHRSILTILAYAG